MEQQTSSTTTDFEQTRKAAEHVVARLLNGQALGHDNPNASQFLDADVKIDTGLDDTFWENKQHNERIRFTIETPAVDQFPNYAYDAIEKVIQSIPDLDKVTRARSEQEELHYVKSKLGELKESGADICESVFKWAGFDKENESNYEVPDYLVSANMDSFGVKVDLNLPKHLPNGMTAEDIATNIKGRITDIKDMLAERIAKHQDKHNEGKEAIREKLANLEFSVVSKNDTVSGNHQLAGDVQIIIQSPEQKEKYDSMNMMDLAKAESDPVLADTNILQTFSPIDLNKALSRSLQSAGGDKAMEVMPVILGTQDMLRKLEKVLKPFEEQHPEFEHQIADVLNSNVLGKSSWQDRNNSEHFTKQQVKIRKKAEDEERGIMTVDMAVPKHEAAKILETIAAMEPQEQFASVDSMELVGAYSPNQDLHQRLQIALAPLVGQPIPANPTPVSEDKMKPFAEKLIKLIEEAHSHMSDAMQAGTNSKDVTEHMTNMFLNVQDAHQTVVDGIKAGAEQAATEHASAQTETSYVNANPPHAETPSPIMTPDWVQRLAIKTQDSGTQALGA